MTEQKEHQHGALVEKSAQSGEIAMKSNAIANAMAAGAMAEIRLAMQMALENPRNESHAIGRVTKCCKRFAFAERALYSFPRGGTTVSGASIRLAEEMAKCWTNLRWGFYVVLDEGQKRTVRGWAWDLEANAKKEIDLTFDKLIYRKNQGWITPDERDLLELTNRQGSKAVRNAILGLLPWDIVQDAMSICRQTVQEGIKDDPDKFSKNMIQAFQLELGISGSELVNYVGFPLEQMTPAQLTNMRELYRAIKDGETTWQDAVGRLAQEEGLTSAPPKTASEMRKWLHEKAQNELKDEREKKR